MKNTFAIKFYCRPAAARKDGYAPVEVSLTVSGQRQIWQLPKKCRPEDFKTDIDIQMYCDAVRTKLNKIQSNLFINDEPISAYKIKDIYLHGSENKSYTLKNLFDDGLRIKKSENRDLGTYRKYELVSQRFFDRTGLHPDMEANRATVEHILLFKIEADKEHGPVTVSKELKHLKYFFSLAFNSGKIKANPFASYKIKSEQPDKPYLEYDEILKIKKCRITNDRLERTRDLFLFMCFTGLEWADIVNLEKTDVQVNRNKQYYIRKPRIKTGIEYVTILHEDAVDIWQMYHGELPIISPQKFNMNLKELAALAGIKKEVTSLTARHSYACFLLNYKKLSIETVSKMLGHKTTNQTRHYAKLFAETVFEQNRLAYTKPTDSNPDNLEQYQEHKKSLEEFSKLLGLDD